MKKFTSFIIAFIFIVFSAAAQSTGDFRSKSAGPANWNDFNSWERYDGSAWVAATSGQLPSATSVVEIQAGHAITLNGAGLTSGNLTVNGSLTYDAVTISGLTVSGNVTVNTGGSFTSPSSGSVLTHTLSLGGDLTVDGTFNMNAVATAAVAVTFTGATNNVIAGTGTTIKFYSLTINKGNSINSILDVTSVITIVSPFTTGIRLTITNGTFKLSSASVLTPYYGGQTPVSSTGRLWLNNTGASITNVGVGTTTGAGRLMIPSGTLQITAGTFGYGSGGDVHSFGSAGPNLILDGPNAVMNIYGGLQLAYNTNFTMSAGNINVYPQAGNNLSTYYPLSFEGYFLIATNYNITGGTITIVDPLASTTSATFNCTLTNGTFNLSGLTLRFGDGTSNKPGGTAGFSLTSTLPIANIVVNNNPSSVLTSRYVKLLGALTAGNVTVNSGSANNLDLNGYVLTVTGNLTDNGNINTDGSAANGLTFTGTTQQTISGTGTFTNNNIRNLVINNTSGATPAVDIKKNFSVSTALTLTNGIVGTSNASVLTFGRSASSNTFTLTRSGGSLSLTPSPSFTGVTGINYTYSTPSPAAATTTGPELLPAVNLNTLTISNTSGVTLDKPVTCTTLSLSAILNADATNTITALTGVAGGSTTAYVNGPLTRSVTNSLSAANYRFPVGKAGFQLFEFASLTTGGTGTGTITVEAFDAGPYTATAGTGLSAINTDKYWKLNTTLGSVTINPSSTVRLSDAGIVTFNVAAQSDASTGTYSSLGGSITAGSNVTSLNPFSQATLSAGTYFRVGTAAAFAAGNYAIGPQASYAGYAGTFPSVTAAIAAMTNTPFPGNVVFEFQSDYVPSVETYPMAFTVNIFSTATATITIRPAADVSSLINFSSTGAILTNTGADYVTFDGRPGGTGTNRFLKFTTTSTTLAAVNLSNNSTNNKFQYCLFKGTTTAASTGVFTTGSTSNSPLTIDNCDFDASGTANSCLYISSGIPDISVTNSTFYDFRAGYGIYVGTGSTNAIVDNNNIYQTTAYNGVAGTTTGIYINGVTNARISNNNIGGSGPALAGIWTVNSTSPVANNFTGITATSLTTSTVYNNKIQNIDWKCSTCTWTGISTSGGSGSVGTDGANYIGSNTGNDNIKVTYFQNAANPQFYGISTGSGIAIENNVIGSITTALSGATTTSCSFTGIYSSSSTGGIINNNTIGSLTTPLSINTGAQQGAAVSAYQYVYGISVNAASSANMSITNNKIANIRNSSIVSTGLTKGINLTGSPASVNISSNTVASLTTATPATGTGTSSSLDGIVFNGTFSGLTITGNSVYDLNNTTASAAVLINGITFYCTSATGGVIEKNLVHSFKSTSPAAIQNGIYLAYGLCTVRNNVVRLGIDITGASMTSTTQINGINKTSTSTGTFGIYHNTVYIGGTGVTDGATTYTGALNLVNHSNEDIRNNIFLNMRTNSVTSKKHCALLLAAGTTTTNLIFDYNIYNCSSTDGLVARMGTNNYTNMGALIAALPGTNLNSGFGDPSLISPAAAMATMNLKPNAITPAEGMGINIAGVTDDFAGAVRSGLTPTDIGAYADNYTTPGASEDIWYPVISYTTLTNTSSTANRTTVNFATITDSYTGLNLTPGTKPRMYFKKSTDANAFAGNTSADNGWKWVESATGASPFDFTIDYSIINGGSVAIGDIIQYFVVAQDLATTPNVSFNPSNGATGTSVASAGMTAPTTPNSYTIYPVIGPSVNVGTGQTYPNLTGATGLFAALNAGVITSNIVANIKTDITEPGTVGLNPILEEGPNAGTLTLTIQSDGSPHVISGGTSPYTAPMIPINGASRVTINGGAGKLLTFRNANAAYNTTGPVIQFNNGSQNCVVTNCYLESNAYAYQAPFVAAELVLGNTGANSVTINNNDFRDARGVSNPNYPRGAIYSNSVNNTLIITNNNIYNFRDAFTSETAWGIMLNAVANGVVITGNSFYMESGITPVCGLYCIYINGGNSHNISNNYIGGSGPMCSGTWSGTTPSSLPTYGIYLVNGTAPASTIQGNTFSSFTFPSTGYFMGIATSASVATITGNTIGSATVANSIQFNGGISYGIYVVTPTAPCTIEGNTVANVTVTSTVSPVFYGIYSSGGLVRKNKIYSIGASQTGATPTFYGIYNATGSASNEFSNNLVALNGGNSGNPTMYGFFDVSTAAGTTGFYFNSINIYGTSTTGSNSTAAFRRNQTAAYVLGNNILSNFRTGGTGTHHAIYSVLTTNFTSNNNDFYVSGANFGYFGSAKANFAAWQAIPLDLNSFNLNPSFTSNTDLHTAVPQLNNTGVAVTGITSDLGNATRTNPPDIGAYEFFLPVAAVHTLSATSIGHSTAVLNGDINTQNEVVTMSFEYGLTPAYGSNVAATPASIQSLSLIPANGAVSGLTPGTTYHYRAKGVATTSSQTVYGADSSFTTLGPSLAGPNNPCQGAPSIYTTDGGYTNYSWTVSAGGTVTAGGTSADTSVTVVWNTGGLQSVSVNYENPVGFPAPAPNVMNINVRALEVPGITGPLTPCAPSAGNIYITESGKTNYIWTISSGGVIKAGGTTASNTISVQWNAVSPETVSVLYTGTNGCTPAAPTVINITPSACPVQAISPANVPQFVDPLPHFAAGLRVNAKAGGNLIIKAVPHKQISLSTGTVLNHDMDTIGKHPGLGMGNYWTYIISKDNGATWTPANWPAFTIEAQRGFPLSVKYMNGLFNQTYDSTGLIVDQTIHWAMPVMTADPYSGPVPLSPHLHGGEIPSESDGGPYSWFTPGYALTGPTWGIDGVDSIYNYPNTQEAATLWFHDHAMGATRLNVYAGLAGFYFLRGTDEETGHLPGWTGDDLVKEITPAGKTATFNANAYLPEIELAIQDRMFNDKGGLWWPNNPPNPAIHPYWTPEFFGNIMTVNGKSWPYLSVAPRKYRFRVLDGCNARFLNMWLKDLSTGVNGPAIQVIASDGGLIDHPATLDPASGKRLFMAPGERYEIVIDFSGVAPGSVWTLVNDANYPYPNGAVPDTLFDGRIMQFIVNGEMRAAAAPANPGTDLSSLPNNLRSTPTVKLTDHAGTLNAVPDKKRQVTLSECSGEGGPIESLLNNAHYDNGGMMPGGFGDLTEHPREGKTELWQITNLTEDAHPIHMHLVQFQLVSRQDFDLVAYKAAYAAAFPGGIVPQGGGSPNPYDSLNTDGAVGGNPALTPYLTPGTIVYASPEETGWKDTYKCLPGQVTTFLVRYTPTDLPLSTPPQNLLFPFDPSSGPGYVWHCHIVDHEDNEMMRPNWIEPSAFRAEPVCLNAPGNIYHAPKGMTNYDWHVPAGGTVTAGGTATDSLITITWTTAGEKLLTVFYTSNGNPLNVPSSLIVMVQPPVLAGTIAADQSICPNTAPLPLTSVTPGTGSGTITYEWEKSVDGGTSWTLIAGATGDGYAPGVLSQTTLFHRITVSTLNSFACRAASPSVTITVNPIAAAFSASNTTPALNIDVTLTDQSAGTPISWQWTITPGTFVYTGGTSSTSQNPVVQFTSNGMYTVKLIINNGSCSDTLIKPNYIVIGTPGLWTGLTSGDWNVASNWDNNTVPDATTNVLIPDLAPNWPVFTGNFIMGTHCNNLTLNSATSTLNVTGDFTIPADKSVTNYGIINIEGNMIVQ